MIKKIVTIIFIIILIRFTSATPINPTSLDKIGSQRAIISGNEGTDDSLAGNITEIKIISSSITGGWQGYYGNVSGTIVLDDALNNSMYIWVLSTASGKVFASNISSINWTEQNVVCLNDSWLAIENNRIFPGVNSGSDDNITNTFKETTHPAFNIGSRPFAQDECKFSLSTLVNNSNDTARTFNETILWSISDGAAIYMAYIVNDKTGFKTSGAAYDFQMLVGEDGHENTDITPYYFFIELEN